MTARNNLHVIPVKELLCPERGDVTKSPPVNLTTEMEARQTDGNFSCILAPLFHGSKVGAIRYIIMTR